MTTNPYPWISRRASREIYQKILTKPGGVHIYFVQASAGVGKTFMARDIGTQLGSETGYEPGHRDDIYWSGITDLYDPDTSNSKRIEQHWIQAFSSLTGFEFRNYQRQREAYESKAQEVALPSELEKQVENIRKTFAQGMEVVSKERYPIMAFDTVERLETVFDPAQKTLNIQAIDPPDVFDWLNYQILYLPRGIIMMMGRSVPQLIQELQRNVTRDINPQRKTRGLEPVSIEIISLKYLSATERAEFFRHRLSSRPELEHLLDDKLKSLLATNTKGNPLLLDIAIQTLLETRDPEKVRSALESSEGTKGMEAVEAQLLSAYMQYGSDTRQGLLTFLVIARNGLFDGLLKHLDPGNFARLQDELEQIRNLPFIKVRNISVVSPGHEQRVSQRTYFLHDEMYTICDRVPLVPPEQIRRDSKKIVDWYDAQIQQHLSYKGSVEEGRRPEAITDLLVESLPYRMRSDPERGYQWYMEQSDRAIRGGERGLDSRLRDAMAQFISSADEKAQRGDVPFSFIDHQILISEARDLYKDFQVDSALLWIKRYSVRGRHTKALEIAQNVTWVKEAYLAEPKRYLVTYAELRLWLGQSAMYAGNPKESLEIYNETLGEIEKIYPPDEVRKQIELEEISSYESSRLCLVAGRTYNNRGYIYWMYMGRYWSAINEFHEALKYFELVNLPEETANSKDNIGRVYAILGYSFPSFEAIREGLELRTSVNLDYREALSRNSLAIAYAQFDNIPQAMQEVESALHIFRRIRIERGIALAQLTRGLIYRTQGELWRELRLTVDQALELIDKGETDLLEALGTFTDAVQEPIRNVQAYNELGCCYRTRYLLLKHKKDIEGQRLALRRGISYFELAISTAEQHDFLVEKLDSLQDRAVLYARAGQFSQSNEDLETVCNLIPLNHKILPDKGFAHLEKTNLVDAYYKLLGQVELLSGAIDFERANQAGKGSDRRTLLEMVEHYILAVAYFNTFSGESFTNRQTNSRIYARLRRYDRALLIELKDHQLEKLIEKYNLPVNAVRGQFDEVFGLLIPGSKVQRWG